ncbi:MGH1-like glycoside hydrolase domain-containing protein [Aureimonas leprariae]|uniref:Glucosidase n=1 Tax=Plantimonas leprariae TaxID=2615207 RepID=A0A7V7PMM0_9HYPH|nr:glucosidase [Aureimonas leprariae]KAB0678491.1 glucosidase [Aureimonas leprariae]
MASTGPSPLFDTAEGRRLLAADRDGWRRWGPYLSERQWGTVREDYSANGDAWEYFPHDHARSRAYRWGEDGIAGFCDDTQRWCLSLALWNGADPILKERMFGLSNPEGNHGEDVKELWWYLDGTPTHSYGRMLYRYPHAAFPYDDLVAENRRRKGRDLPEYELIDTGVLDANRYFDVEVEYAKAGPDDVLMRVAATNRGGEAAPLHILPQLAARNTWSWTEGAERPTIGPVSANAAEAARHGAPTLRFEALQPAELLFCRNETNPRRFGGTDDGGAFKDAINDRIVAGDPRPLPPEGTKCAAVSRHTLQPGETLVLRYRLCRADADALDAAGFEAVCTGRRQEADEFYAVLQGSIADPDARLVQRQALAGLLWSKQFYRYGVKRWLDGDPTQAPPPAGRRRGRNADWTHLDNADIVLMPDKWEYPWYASWDLAFHAVAMALVDPGFAKGQLLLLTCEWYMHPSGQLPAYEWAFGDANPPIQAFAALRVYRMDAAMSGTPDRAFLERMFHKLMLNFTWWVNRKDARGRNLYQGGFLGLDNIGVFDRSQPVPGGGTIDQADGTAWMAMYALNLMRMALELAADDPVYEDIATKFFEHFLYIASAMTHVGGTEAEKNEGGADGRGLWDETDGFFYDVLELPDGGQTTLRVRSLVGLIPLCAVEVLGADLWTRFPDFARRTQWMLRHRPDLTEQVSRFGEPGKDERLLLSLLRRYRMTALLARMLDENEFLSPHGLRSLSKAHGEHPFAFECNGRRFAVDYEPGNSTSAIFGGNSNWRGPVWMPLNYMLIEGLREFERFYGAEFRTECPTGSGKAMGLGEIADELSRRAASLFLRDAHGRRPVFGGDARFDDDPLFRDLVPFHEFFDGETGQGLGAAHQTGWTSLVALLIGADAEPRPTSRES